MPTGEGVFALSRRKDVRVRLRIDLPIEGEAILQRNPDFLIVEILDPNLVFNRAVGLASAPFPGQAQMRRRAIVDEGNALFTDLTGLAVEVPMQKSRFVRDVRGWDQDFGSAVLPSGLSDNPKRSQPRSPFARLQNKFRVGGLEPCARLTER